MKMTQKEIDFLVTRFNMKHLGRFFITGFDGRVHTFNLFRDSLYHKNPPEQLVLNYFGKQYEVYRTINVFIEGWFEESNMNLKSQFNSLYPPSVLDETIPFENQCSLL